MRLWLSSEVDAEVDEKDRIVSNRISSFVNPNLVDKNYGSGVVVWGHINIIMKKGVLPDNFFQEIKKYHLRNKQIEFRLKIDHQKFLVADDKTAAQLICQSILRSVEIARKEFKIPDFDLDSFEVDLRRCFIDFLHLTFD